MTESDIERMAREADPEFGNSDGDMPDAICGMPAITRFAGLVRAQALEDAAQTAERISDKYQETESRKWPELRSDAETGADSCAAAIRALASLAQSPAADQPEP